MNAPAKTSTAAPHLYDFIDRSQTEIPEWYLPSALGVLLVAKDTLAAAGRSPVASSRLGWSRRASGWSKPAADGAAVLWVQRCGHYWGVERMITSSTGDKVEEALCCAFAGVPFWAPTREAAMRLAEHCHPIPQPPIAGCWMPTF
jgi:hypothetical protein